MSIISVSKYSCMEKERVKLIVNNLELLLSSLKKELNLDERPNLNYEEVGSYLDDYDEVFYDEED